MDFRFDFTDCRDLYVLPHGQSDSLSMQIERLKKLQAQLSTSNPIRAKQIGERVAALEKERARVRLIAVARVDRLVGR